MKIRTKLLIAYMVVSALVMAVLQVSFVANRTADMAFREMSVHGIPLSKSLHDLRTAALRIVASTSEYLFIGAKHDELTQPTGDADGDPESSGQRERDLIAGGEREFLEAIERYQSLSRLHHSHGTALSSDIEGAGHALVSQSHDLVQATDKGVDFQALLERKEHFEEAETRLILLIDTALNSEERELNSDIAGSIGELNRVREHYISLVVFLLLSAIGAAMAVTRFFSRPLRLLAERAQRIAHENGALESGLGSEQEVQRNRSEIEELNSAFDAMERRLLESHAHLRRHQENLEITIAERTRELEDTVSRAEALARDARAASDAKAAFLANMSHEIRTPLNGVLGTAELLSHSELSAHQHELVETINRSGDSLLRIINDILDFSKIDAGRLDLELTPFSPGNTLEEAVNLLAPGARAKSVELIADLEPSTYINVLGDAGRLRQIVLNLTSNAIKFTERGYVQLRMRADDAPEGAVKLTIEIEDSGIGISAHAQKQLFQPFAQADASTTRRFGGSGLGLAISRQLAEIMDGSLELHSEEGKGTLFTLRVTLPLISRPVAKPKPLLTLHALLFQPEARARTATLRHLRDLGVHVETTNSMQETLEAAHRQHFDLILAEDNQSDDWARLSVIATQQVTRLILIGQQQDSAHRNTQRISAQLNKPVTRTQLTSCLRNFASDPDAPRQSGGDTPPLVAPAPMVHPMKVLLAEDNAVNRMVATQMLKRLGVTTHAVHNGVEALAALEEGRFDLVLMDCHMPEMDGYSATGHIRECEARAGTARIPVIALTAGALKGDRERALEAGMDDFLTKPVNLNALRTVLSKWGPQPALAPSSAPVSSI